MALRAEINFANKPDGNMPAVWDTPVGAPLQQTGTMRKLIVKGGKLRLDTSTLTWWDSFMSWFGQYPGASEYIPTPLLDAPVHTVGMDFVFSSENHTRTTRTGDLCMGIVDGPVINAPNPNIGVHLAIRPDGEDLSSREVTTFYDAHTVSGALALDTKYNIEAHLNHAAKSVTLVSPWGTQTFTNERYDRLSKNYAFFEQYCQNMLSDDYADIVRFYAYAD